MATKVIRMSLSAESIQNARNELIAYRKKLEDWVTDFLKHSSEVAEQVAKTNFPGQSVTIEPIPNGYQVIASGRGVCFLEFGAGWGTDSGHPYAQYVSIDVRPGTWSRNLGLGRLPDGTKGKHPNFADDGFWYFGGKFYNEVQARRGMYEAMQRVKEYLRKKEARGVK